MCYGRDSGREHKDAAEEPETREVSPVVAWVSLGACQGATEILSTAVLSARSDP